MEENAEENALSAEYRNARKARTEGNFETASKKFTHIVEEDAGCSEWSLKALKQLIKIDRAKNDEAALLRHFKRFLNDCGMGMCTDELELSIRRILQRVSERPSLECARSCLEKTVDYFKESGDDLRWFKFAVLLSKHYLRMAEHVLFFPLVRELKDAVKAEKDAEKKAAMSVDLAVLELGYSTDHVPDAQLAQSWYEKARDGAMTVRPMNPCTTAVIAEREGHAAFEKGRYWESQHNFFAAFKLLDAIRSEDALRLLKMAMITRALTTEEEDHLPEEAARRHSDHNEVVQTRELLRIWDTRPFHEFQAATHSARFALVGRLIDGFLQKFVAFGRRRLIARLVSEDDWIGILQFFPALKIDELASIVPMLPAVVDNCREHLPLRDIERVDIRCYWTLDGNRCEIRWQPHVPLAPLVPTPILSDRLLHKRNISSAMMMKRMLGRGVGHMFPARHSFAHPMSLVHDLSADRPSTSRAAAAGSSNAPRTCDPTAAMPDEYDFEGTYKDARKYIKENLSFVYIRKLDMRCSNKQFPLACAAFKNIGSLSVQVWPSARFDWRTFPSLQRCEKVTYVGSKSLRLPERFIHAAIEKQTVTLTIAGKPVSPFRPGGLGFQPFATRRIIMRFPRQPSLRLSSDIVLDFLFEERTRRLKRKMHVPDVNLPRGFLRQLIQAHHASTLTEEIGLVVERGRRLARELAAYHCQNPNQLELINEQPTYLIRGAEMSLRFGAYDLTTSIHRSIVIQRGPTRRLEPRRAVAPIDPLSPADFQALQQQRYDEADAWYDEMMRDLAIGE